MAPVLPRIAVIVITHNDLPFLADCFSSLAAMDYPAAARDFILFDNASTDDSVAFVRQHFPAVRIISSPDNLGFARGMNQAVAAAGAPLVALLNPDMRVDPGWLRELASTRQATGAACIAGKILRWDGTTLDFAGTSLNFCGYGIQDGAGVPVAADNFTDDAEVLAPCGGAMLIDRQVFLNLGGFDEHLVAFYEDLDLGWRLWLHGQRVCRSARAITYHHGSGTWRRAEPGGKYLLGHRNALLVLCNNLDEENLQRLFTPLVLMAIRRALLLLGLKDDYSREEYDRLFATLHEPASLDRLKNAAAQLFALHLFIDELPESLARRAACQRGRVVSDAELFRKFRHTPVFADMFAIPHNDAFIDRMISRFKLEPLFSPGELDRFRAQLAAGFEPLLREQHQAIASQETLLARLNSELDVLHNELAAQQRTAGQLRQELAQLGDELQGLRAEHAALKNHAGNLEAFAERVQRTPAYRAYRQFRKFFPRR